MKLVACRGLLAGDARGTTLRILSDERPPSRRYEDVKIIVTLIAGALISPRSHRISIPAARAKPTDTKLPYITIMLILYTFWRADFIDPVHLRLHKPVDDTTRIHTEGPLPGV